MTENQIMVFKNDEFGEIRTVMVNDEPWWVLKDVCDILNIENHKDLPKRLDDDEVGRLKLPHPQSSNKTMTMLCVNESGLYSVILRSDKPEAKPFRKWVTSEVLPAIRKTGGYVAKNSELYQYIKAMEQSITQLQQFNVSIASQYDKLNEKILALSPVLNQKKINIWKSKFIKPGIAMLIEKYEIDERSAYDLVYDRMSSRYGFDRSCAINEFCDKYKTEICYVTDAIADYEPYRKYFMDCVYELLCSDDLKSAAQKTDLQKVEYNETFDDLINSLAKKSNDKTAYGIGSLGKVYKAMMSDSDWKQMMSQKHCSSKKQLILNDSNLFDNFRSVALNMLGGAEM